MVQITKNRNFAVLFACVSAAILLVRLVSLWFNNSQLFFDEAQYWYWAQALEFGYFSKPPLLAGIIAASTKVCGSDSEFCTRLSSPFLHLGTSAFIYLSAKRLFDERTAFWAGMIFATLPAVSLSSTIISTDVPLLFCWSISLYAYIRLAEEFQMRWALLLGFAIGLGLNAKYAMAYFTGCAVIHALVEQQILTPARRKEFWFAVLIGVLFLVPNIVWNLQNSFVTVSHTGDNIGWDGFNPNWKGLGEFVGSQFGVFGPILFGMFVVAAIRMFKDSISRQHRLLLCFSLPVLLLISAQAVMSKAYANWAATTYVAATILVAEILVNRVAWGWMRTSMGLHVAAFIGIAVAVCFAGPGQLVLPGGAEPFRRTQGAGLIANEARTLLNSGNYAALITTDRKLSALMQYNLRDREEAILAWRASPVAHDHFQLKAAYQDMPIDPVLVISRSDNIKSFSRHFAKAKHLGQREISAGEIERVYFFALDGYEKAQ